MMEITGHTQIFGILADPIHHVKTPQGINRLLEARRFDGVMVPIHVGAEGLGAMVDGLRRMNNLGGFVVTVPHKTAMPALCDELTPAAQRIGAVNVVRRTGDGRLVGGMLDGEGFVAGLRSEGIEPAGLATYLAGAGGAAGHPGRAVDAAHRKKGRATKAPYRALGWPRRRPVRVLSRGHGARGGRADRALRRAARSARSVCHVRGRCAAHRALAAARTAA